MGYIKAEDILPNELIDLIQMDRDECIKAFEEYKKENGLIY